MPRAFDDHDIFAVGAAVKGAADAVLQLRANLLGVLQVLLREIWADGHGRHRGDGNVQIEEAVDEKGVFVDLVITRHHYALGDRFDIAHVQAHRLQGGREAEASGGLAVVHARRRHKDAAGIEVHRAREQPGDVLGEALTEGHV